MSKTYKLIRLPGVQEQTGYSRSAIYQKIKEGNFPAPIKLGPRAVAWIQSEIDGWCAKQIAKSRDPQTMENARHDVLQDPKLVKKGGNEGRKLGSDVKISSK